MTKVDRGHGISITFPLLHESLIKMAPILHLNLCAVKKKLRSLTAPLEADLGQLSVWKNFPQILKFSLKSFNKNFWP